MKTHVRSPRKGQLEVTGGRHHEAAAACVCQWGEHGMLCAEPAAPQVPLFLHPPLMQPWPGAGLALEEGAPGLSPTPPPTAPRGSALLLLQVRKAEAGRGRGCAGAPELGGAEWAGAPAGPPCPYFWLCPAASYLSRANVLKTLGRHKCNSTLADMCSVMRLAKQVAEMRVVCTPLL